ncbi:MAG TPA: (d)CMP kinase [Bryobacteraceae bacterium]
MGKIIAIDGPAGAGKSTIARRVAARLGFTYIDTGAMYRALALWAIRQNLNPSDSHRMEQLALAADIALDSANAGVFLNGEDVTEAIRTPTVSDAASRISAIPAVRRAMVDKQRVMGVSQNVVMEGRDIGTVVFPEATVKIFLDADPHVRVDRRHSQTGGTRHEIAGEIAERDRRDTTRSDSPLAQAPDAVYLNSSQLNIEEVEEAVLRLVRERISNGKDYRDHNHQ